MRKLAVMVLVRGRQGMRCKARTHKAPKDHQQTSAQPAIPTPRPSLPSAASFRLQQLPAGLQQQPSSKVSHTRSLLKLPPGALIITRPSSMQHQHHKRSLLSQQQQQQLAAGVQRKQVVAADASHSSRAASLSSSRKLEAARAYAAAAQAKQQGELKPSADRLRSKVHPWPYYKPHRTHDLVTLWCNKTSVFTL